MAVKACASITISKIIDIKSVWGYYLLQSSTLPSPTVPTVFPPTGGWDDTEPSYTEGSTNSLYYVECTVFGDDSFQYSNVSLSSSYEAAKSAYNKAVGAENTAKETAKKAIINTTEEFYQSNSATTLTGGSWSTSQPTWESGKYIWRRTIVTYGSGETEYLPNETGVCITGNTGKNGSNGRGISSVDEKYAVSSSKTNAPTTWYDDVQAMTSTNKYLWNYEVVTYSDGGTAETKKRVIGVYGDTGKPGADGKDGAPGAEGNGIAGIAQYYLASAAESGVTTNTSGWTVGMQTTTTTKKYLWNYEVVTYTNGKQYTSTPVIIGTHGATGATGPQGPQGATGATGATGPQGEPGAKGDKGDKGDTGAQGVKGDKGDKGATGATGPQGAKGDTGAQGYSVVASVSRPSFTEAQWTTYGTVGHVENWSNTSSIRNGCRVGDIFLVTGTATDTKNAHVAYYRCDNSSGDLHGVCISHSIAERGATGATGPQGPQGPTGATGAAGKDGQMLYATCGTAAATVAKVATLASGSIALSAGVSVSVKFTYANTAASPTLNVGGTGAKAIYTNGVNAAYWSAGQTVLFTYSGTDKKWYVASTPVYASTVTVGNAAGNNVFIDDDSVYIKSGDTALASFSASKVELGKNYVTEGTDVIIDLCNQSAQLGIFNSASETLDGKTFSLRGLNNMELLATNEDQKRKSILSLCSVKNDYDESIVNHQALLAVSNEVREASISVSTNYGIDGDSVFGSGASVEVEGLFKTNANARIGNQLCISGLAPLSSATNKVVVADDSNNLLYYRSPLEVLGDSGLGTSKSSFTAAVSAKTETATQLGSLTLPAGLWAVQFGGYCSGGSGGTSQMVRFELGTSTSSPMAGTYTRYVLTTYTGTGTYAYNSTTAFCNPESSTKYYIYGKHWAGSNVNLRGYIYAYKLL